MALRSVILWTLFSVIVVFVLSTGVQAQGLRDVPASDILKQIRNGEDVDYENVNITGKLDLSKINLTTVPNTRPKWKVLLYELYYLEKELNIVESNITIQDSVFEDDVDFSNTEFRKDVEFIKTSFLSYNDFLGANFAGYANFSDVNFSDDACFEEANFAGYACFKEANFTAGARFGYANFTAGARFGYANFAGDADFEGATFAGDANFSDANFAGNADFEGATFVGYNTLGDFVYSLVDNIDANFAGDANFNDANFTRDAYFTGANFAGNAYFTGANFAGNAHFLEANFTGDANFNDANFTGDAGFWRANFAGNADFWRANFADHADFWRANFARDARFREANFTGNAYFDEAKFARDARFREANFTGNATFFITEFDKVYFIGATFTNVSLNETDFNQMKVEWSTLKDALVFDGLTYIKLIKNFREMEQFEDADAAYYQYRQLSQANKKWSDSSKLMDVVAGVSCGYGVKPEYPLIWGFILIVVFALVYKLGNGIKRLKSKENGDSRVSIWDAFYFSVTTFTTVGYGDWYPEDRYRKFVMIEGVIGWLLLALFLVTLANVMIRP